MFLYMSWNFRWFEEVINFLGLMNLRNVRLFFFFESCLVKLGKVLGIVIVM